MPRNGLRRAVIQGHGRLLDRARFDTRGMLVAEHTCRLCLIHFLGRLRCSDHCTNFVQKDLAGFGLAAIAPFEIFRKISQNLSPAGVTSPFEARAMPTDATSVVRVSGR